MKDLEWERQGSAAITMVLFYSRCGIFWVLNLIGIIIMLQARNVPALDSKYKEVVKVSLLNCNLYVIYHYDN